MLVGFLSALLGGNKEAENNEKAKGKEEDLGLEKTAQETADVLLGQPMGLLNRLAANSEWLDTSTLEKDTPKIAENDTQSKSNFPFGQPISLNNLPLEQMQQGRGGMG